MTCILEAPETDAHLETLAAEVSEAITDALNDEPGTATEDAAAITPPSSRPTTRHASALTR